MGNLTPSMTALSIMTLSITTLSMTIKKTLSTQQNDRQHSNENVMLCSGVVMLRLAFYFCHIFIFAEWRCAKCRHAECHSATDIVHISSCVSRLIQTYVLLHLKVNVTTKQDHGRLKILTKWGILIGALPNVILLIIAN